MKKLIICFTLAAFALIPAVQAGEKTCDAKTACCANKAKASGDSCCAKKVALKKADATSKGATLLVQR